MAQALQRVVNSIFTTMTGAIMQAYFFPYLGYFQVIAQVDEFVLYDLVTFRQRTWMTRNRLLKKGLDQEVVINIPVRKSSSFKLIKEIEISDFHSWKKYFLKLIHHDYGKACYFDDVYPLVQDCLSGEDISLHRFNCRCLKKICQFIGIRKKIVSGDERLVEIEEKLEERALQSQIEPKAQRIIDICRDRGWSSYINPEGGAEIYNKEDFQKRGIEMKFWKSALPSYSQFSTEFHPGLSILDGLMHVGPEGVREMLHAGFFF